MSHLESNSETSESGADIHNPSQGELPPKPLPPRRIVASDQNNGVQEDYPRPVPERSERPPPPPPPPKPQKMLPPEPTIKKEEPPQQQKAPPPPPPRADKPQEREYPMNGTVSVGFPYRSRDIKANPKDPNSSPIRTDNERLRVSPNRVLNYGSMERSRRGEHRNPHFERRLSYGYGQPSVVHGDQMDGRIQYNSPHRNIGTGSLERGGKHFGYMDRDYGFKRGEKFQNQNYTSVKTNDQNDYSGVRTNASPSSIRRDGGSPGKIGYGPAQNYGSDGSIYNFGMDSPSKNDRMAYGSRYSPSKTDSLNRTSYYSHASRMESQESLNSIPNVRRSSYDFDSSPSKGDNAVRHGSYGGYKADPQGKPVLPDFGGDRRRLSQPPTGTSGVPPPFYHPPPPPGKFF